MHWHAIAANNVITLTTQDFLDSVKEADAQLFANNFTAELRRRLKAKRYTRCDFRGPKDATTVAWGGEPGIWFVRVAINGGRPEYHTKVLLKLFREQGERTLAELALHYAQQAAKVEPSRIIMP